MFLKVSDIAKVGCGLVVTRKKTVYHSEMVKKYKQLNLRAINKNGYIEKNELENLPAKEIIDNNYLTHEGDIIVRLTEPFTAVYITKEFEGIVISSNFCIVRCLDKRQSGFLTYYLNSDTTRKSLFSSLQGSIMKNVNTSDIGNLIIPNLSIERQILYGEILSAQTKKLMILAKIKELELKQQKAILKQIDNFEV